MSSQKPSMTLDTAEVNSVDIDRAISRHEQERREDGAQGSESAL